MTTLSEKEIEKQKKKEEYEFLEGIADDGKGEEE